MNITSTKTYLEVILLFKKFLNQDLFNILTNPHFDLNSFNTDELLKLKYLINNNLIDLLDIINKLASIKNINLFDSRLETLPHSSSIFIKNSEFYNSFEPNFVLNKSILDNITLEDINYLDFHKLITLLYRIYNFIDIEKINYINSSEIINDSLNLLNKLYLKNISNKQSTDKIYSEKLGKKIPIRNFISTDKRIQIGVVKKTLVDNLNNHLIVAKFSDSQIIKDKTKQKEIHALEISTPSLLDMPYHPNLDSRILKEKNNNIRKNLSVIASICFTKNTILNNILFTLFYDIDLDFKNCARSCGWHNFKKDNYIYDYEYIKIIMDLHKINIKNIFIIDPKYKRIPLFLKKPIESDILSPFSNNQKLFINYISLDDFCLFYATLHIEKLNKKIRKATKYIDINEGINLNENITIDSDHLIAYFSKLIDLNNSIFIFRNSTWDTILQNFYKYGIEISGGSTVKRHLLSPMNYVLSVFNNALSSQPYQDSVITTNLLNESLYKSKFTKPLENLYHKDKFRDRILAYINKLEDLNNYFISTALFDGFDIFKNYYNPEFKYDLKYFILNNWLIRTDNEYSEDQILSTEDINLYKNFNLVLNSSFKKVQESVNKKGNKGLNKKENNVLKLSKLFKIGDPN